MIALQHLYVNTHVMNLGMRLISDEISKRYTHMFHIRIKARSLTHPVAYFFHHNHSLLNTQPKETRD